MIKKGEAKKNKILVQKLNYKNVKKFINKKGSYKNV